MSAAEPTTRARVVVLLSGTGSLCAALLNATDDPGYPAEVVAVGSDRPAEGLAHATRRGLPTFVRAVGDHPDRAAWDRVLADEIAAILRPVAKPLDIDKLLSLVRVWMPR